MIPALLLGGIVIGGLIITFWDKIKEFVKKVFDFIKQEIDWGTLGKAIMLGAATYLETDSWEEAAKAMIIFYLKNATGKIVEMIKRKRESIPYSELPSNIRNRIKNSSSDTHDISQELKNEL